MQPNAFLTLGIALLSLCFGADTRLSTLAADASPRNLIFFEAVFWGSAISGTVFLAAGLYRTIWPAALPKPDMDLREFIDEWLGFSRWHYHNNMFLAKEITDGTHEALTAMAAQARLDHVTVWGSKGTKFQGLVPLSPIPKEEWDHLYVDYLDFLSADNTKNVQTSSNRMHGNDLYYIDIHLNRAQVRRQWPRTRWLRRSRKRFAMWRSGL